MMPLWHGSTVIQPVRGIIVTGGSLSQRSIKTEIPCFLRCSPSNLIYNRVTGDLRRRDSQVTSQ